MKLVTLLIPILLQAKAQAQESNPYYFGGACSSQGAWTQAALTQTDAIKKVARELKDDPNCKALGQSTLAALSSLEAQAKIAADTPQRAARLSQIPQEVQALRSFMSSSPGMQKQALKLILNKSIEGASLSAQVENNPSQNPNQSVATGMYDFGQRLERSTKTGLSLLNQVIDSIPQMDACLTNPNSLGNVLASSVNILASFAGSGQEGLGGQLATTIAKITQVTRDRKYSQVMRSLSEQQFLSSMACLMEVTSETYCSARDSMILFEKGMKELKTSAPSKNEFAVEPRVRNSRIVDNPFAGYYMLTRHIPNITMWLQKVQVGVDPKLPTDAVFQTKIMDEVNNYLKAVKFLIGEFNSGVITIKNFSNTDAKRNETLKLLVKVSDLITGSGTVGQTNFFTTTKVAIQIPFYLIGWEGDLPDTVTGKAPPFITFDAYLSANIDTLPMFKDPERLLETIENRMKLLISEANSNSIEYYNKWFIVDKAALFNESLNGSNFTVKESLEAVNEYLDVYTNRITKYGSDSSNVPTAIDTQQRISAVLKQYSKIKDISAEVLKIRNMKVKTKEDQERLDLLLSQNRKSYEDFINEVYEQFTVMLARSGFLANRMVNFVYQDYVLMLKNKEDFTAHQEELFYATGQQILDRMLAIFNNNPANVKTDLNLALRVNKANIEALETLLKDNLIAQISNLKLIAKTGGTSTLKIAENSFTRALVDSGITGNMTMQDRDSTFSTGWRTLVDTLSVGARPFIAVYKVITNAERYPLSTNGNRTGVQSEFDDVSQLVAQLCTQALAFNDVQSFNIVCAGTELKSPFPIPQENSKDFQDYLSVNYNRKLKQGLEKPGVKDLKSYSINHSDRICAFRDFNRRNLVLNLTLGSSLAK